MQVGAADSARACAQHAGLVKLLRAAGARVLQLPFVHGAYDSVFTKDSAILVERDGQAHALPGTFEHEERDVEPEARGAQLSRAGFTVARPLATTLEGGDVHVIPHRGLALLGHGVRSHRASALGLARFLDCEVATLELCDPALFHLDTALAVLSDDTLVYCRDAFTPRSVRTLEARAFRRVVEVSRADALRFAVNVVEVDRTLVTGTDAPDVAAALARPGRRVRHTPLDQFQLGGGSAACLTAVLQPSRAAIAARAVAA